MNDQWSDILEAYHLPSCPVPDEPCTCRMCEVIEGVANLEAELEQLKEDCKPFQAQIDQAKTYEVTSLTGR